MQPQVPQRVPEQVASDKIVVSHVPALAHLCHDDDVFACHVSDASTNKAWGDVHRPCVPESLWIYPMRVIKFNLNPKLVGTRVSVKRNRVVSWFRVSKARETNAGTVQVSRRTEDLCSILFDGETGRL